MSWPALASFLAFLFLRERIHGFMIAGSLLILCGLVVMVLYPLKPRG